MSTRNLDALFAPRAVALVGATDRPGSVGAVVMRNLIAGGFKGQILPVNPKWATVGGLNAYENAASLPLVPDLAIVCTPPETVPGVIDELGAKGVRAAVVLTAGLNKPLSDGQTGAQAMLKVAKPYLLRILGPNCLGLLIPGIGFNGSFAHVGALPGQIAFVSQSGALCTAVLDWARSNKIGFSHFISLGESADVDFADIIDYLASDSATNAILLYVESIKAHRKFMTAARAASRNKPVIAVKAGRVREGQSAAASHTGALAGNDDVYSAAFARAGILRVDGIEDLFEAVETLNAARPYSGERLCILTNGGGPGVMAVDELIANGGRLASLSQETIAALDTVLPPTWSRANPIDIIGDASGERYRAALDIVLRDPNVDALLVMYAPTAMASSDDAAAAVIAASRTTAKSILACWLGEDGVRHARAEFNGARIPWFETPHSAVNAHLRLMQHRRSQEILQETPPSLPSDFHSDPQAARNIIAKVLADGREMLTELEAKAVLRAYAIPVVATEMAKDAAAAVESAGAIGYPVALKILSRDITHKSDVGGVTLNLETPEAVERAVAEMIARVHRLRPNARIDGFTIQEMVRRSGALELILGIGSDPIFGPILLFGQGGTAVELVADRAVALPPLNLALAGELISRTRIAKLLKGYRGVPAVDEAALRLTLVKLSQLVVDLSEVVELDINPLYADADGVLALDARIRLAEDRRGDGIARLAIRPYPTELVETTALKDGRAVTLRPIKPEDEPAHNTFFQNLSPADLRMRFFGAVRMPAHRDMARLTQIDYDREMAFIATVRHPKPIEEETLGVVRIVADPNNECAEFAVVVRTDCKRQGLGALLLAKAISYLRHRGTAVLLGTVLADNYPMQALAEKFGFLRQSALAEGFIKYTLSLQPAAQPLKTQKPA